MKQALKVPIVLVVQNKALRNHIETVLERAGYDVIFFNDLNEDFWDSIKSVTCLIVFIESSVLKSFGFLFYDEVFKNCPNAKVVLLCSENDRALIRHAIEKGGYGSIVEPYDSWEVTTIIKHLVSDLLTKRNSHLVRDKLSEKLDET